MYNEQLRIRESRRFVLGNLDTAEELADSPEHGHASAYGYLRGTILVMVNDYKIWLAELAQEHGPIPEYGDMPMTWDDSLGQGRN